MAAELDARIAFVKSVASASKSPPIKGLTTNSRLISAASKLPKRHNAEQRTPFFNAIGHPRHFERAPVTSSLHPTSEVSLRCGEPTFRGHLQTHAVEQNPISLDNLVRAGKTVRGVARRRGLTSQQLFTWQRLPVDRSVRAGHIRPGPPRVRHWRFGIRPRSRLARPRRLSRAALRRAQLDEFRQARPPMPGRWKRRRVQTGRNTRRMTAAQRCASQYGSRPGRNRPHETTLLAETPRPAKKCE